MTLRHPVCRVSMTLQTQRCIRMTYWLYIRSSAHTPKKSPASYQKSPKYIPIPKEPYIYTKRALTLHMQVYMRSPRHIPTLCMPTYWGHADSTESTLRSSKYAVLYTYGACTNSMHAYILRSRWLYRVYSTYLKKRSSIHIWGGFG